MSSNDPAAKEWDQMPCNLPEFRCMIQIARPNSMEPDWPRIAPRINQGLKLLLDVTKFIERYDSDLNNAIGSASAESGRFQVNNGETGRQRVPRVARFPRKPRHVANLFAQDYSPSHGRPPDADQRRYYQFVDLCRNEGRSRWTGRERYLAGRAMPRKGRSW
jgi:hypothetical protein